MKKVPTEEEWIAPSKTVAQMSFFNKGWTDIYALLFYNTGEYGLVAFGGYDGYARYMFDTYEEAMSEMQSWAKSSIEHQTNLAEGGRLL